MTSPDDSSPTAFPPDDVLGEILAPSPATSVLLPARFLNLQALARPRCRPPLPPQVLRPPILGVFHNNPRADGRFIGAGNPLDRVSAERFSPQDLRCDRWLVLSGGGRWLSYSAATAVAPSSTTARAASSSGTP
ncbi:hypothetical protein BAE44_0008368 [Dichanthelium oligosanthes]|uniref:Uncharacterized protein n=1 Tax=Dichanthelium oligosanthes TaxID=888268 RepID=A0A1E5VZT8_9POAL|nr:hypothetical protein BAE44_0008368 [Dichanthelium oligosanthes]